MKFGRTFSALLSLSIATSAYSNDGLPPAFSVITITSSGDTFVDDTPVPVASVAEFLDSKNVSHETVIYVRGSPPANSGILRSLFTSLGKRGFRKITAVIDANNAEAMATWKNLFGCQKFSSQQMCAAAGCNWSPSVTQCGPD